MRTTLTCLALVAWLLALPPTALANTCAGSCNNSSADGTCWCDDSCFDFGDCCGDVCTHCPSLAGCGGGGTGDCGNGYCEPTEDASTCPQDCSGGCGSVTYEGCCDGQVVKYCEGGSLKSIDCSQNPSCGWQPEGNYYDCGTGGGADPSGMYPITCTGGSSPVCGNGYCEPGENATSCPNDCGGNQPVCGNGYCEQGETATSCPSDCGGGNQPVCGNGACENGETAASCPSDCGSGCGDKQCGFDGQGNSCGSCPEGFYCTWDGKCESDTPCEPVCTGKQCGDDGCGGSCGTCPAGLVCSAQNVCTAPMGGQDVVTPDDDVMCTGSCVGKVCGDDGCGGNCGECPEGYGCTLEGLCQEGYVPPEDDGGSTEDPYICGPGETLLYGKCVATGEESADDDGCTAGPTGNPATLALLLLLLAALGVRRVRA